MSSRMNVPVLITPESVPFQDDIEQRDGDFQVQWNQDMADVQKNTSMYKRVAVLLISWAAECDDMGVDEEVAKLKDVFENLYHYNVSSVKLNSHQGQMPQLQANAIVANFALKEDGDDTLLIVYYAGHGRPGHHRGGLDLSGGKKSRVLATGSDYISWDVAEQNLKNTKADVLEIFDCCYAGVLGRQGQRFTLRSFEYLAATMTPTTDLPGLSSFTTGLIWALQQFAMKDQGAKAFSTSALAKKIGEAPNFPEDQTPCILSRDSDSTQRIILSPLLGSDNLATGPFEPMPYKPHECVDLQFFFSKEISASELRDLTTHLKHHIKLRGTSLYKVTWNGLSTGPAGKFRSVVRKIIRTGSFSSTRGTPSPDTEQRPSDGMLSPMSTSSQINGLGPADGMLSPLQVPSSPSKGRRNKRRRRRRGSKSRLPSPSSSVDNAGFNIAK